MLSKEREHKNKLPGVKLPEDMMFTSNIEEAAENKDFIVFAVPSTAVRGVAQKIRPFVKDGQIIVDVAKGIEESTLMTLSQQIEEEISGMKLKEQKQENPEGDTAAALKILGIIIAGAILAMIIGNIRRKKKITL